jgi:hypothetical protein
VRPTKEAMRTRLGETRAGPTGTGDPVAPASAPVRLLPISAKIELSLSREIDDHANAHGIARSRAAGHYPTIARETLRSREGVAAGRPRRSWRPSKESARSSSSWGPRPLPDPSSRPLGHAERRPQGLRRRAARRATHGSSRRVGAGPLRGRKGTARGLADAFDLLLVLRDELADCGD